MLRRTTSGIHAVCNPSDNKSCLKRLAYRCCSRILGYTYQGVHELINRLALRLYCLWFTVGSAAQSETMSQLSYSCVWLIRVQKYGRVMVMHFCGLDLFRTYILDYVTTSRPAQVSCFGVVGE